MLISGSGDKYKNRAFELDFLRGIAIIMMMFMHFSYDIRYEFGIDAFDYLHSPWFWTFVHPVIIVLFVGISGICCTFSRNNLKRGLKLLAVAFAFTAATFVATTYLGIYCLILFNVLHMLAVSMLLYALFVFLEKKTGTGNEQMTFVLLLLGLWLSMTVNYIDEYDGVTSNMLFYPLGIDVKGAPPVVDYMPLLPWAGVFFIGAAAGRMLYRSRMTLFSGAGDRIRKITAPLEFLGRHSLIIYLVHQPVIYAVLYLIFLAIGRI